MSASLFEGGTSTFTHQASDPRTLTGAFVTLVRQHYAQPGNEDPVAGYHWTDSVETSQILIEPYYAWTPESIQQRPAVIVSRSPWKVEKMGLGGIEMGSPNVDGYEENVHHAVLSGGHTFFCLGTTGLDAETIATDVAQLLLCFHEQIRKRLCLSQFYLSEIGQVHKLEECREHFAVPVAVQYAVQWNWETLRQAPVWMRTSYEPPTS